MKKINTLLTFVVLSFSTIFLSTSCSSEKKELLFACDSTNTTYTAVKQILENNCYNCHATANAVNFANGIILDNYSSVNNWVDTTSGSSGGTLLVDVMNGRMPKGRSKLTDCEVSKITSWIRNGAKNN